MPQYRTPFAAPMIERDKVTRLLLIVYVKAEIMNFILSRTQ